MTDEQQPPGGSTAVTAQGKPRCAATTTAGALCQAWARPGRPTCQVHDPDRQDIVRAARSKGAAVANRVRSMRGHRAHLTSMTALTREAERTYYGLRDGSIAPDVGQRLFNGLGLLKSLIEASTVDRRLDAMQEQMQQLERRTWGSRWSA